jgi:Tol biopolymer transport system component
MLHITLRAVSSSVNWSSEASSLSLLLNPAVIDRAFAYAENAIAFDRSVDRRQALDAEMTDVEQGHPPLDVEQSSQVLGQAEAVTTPSAFAGHVTISADGRQVAYASLGRTSGIHRIPFDPQAETTGSAVPVLGGSRFLANVAVSPDGQWLLCYSIGNQLDLVLSRSDGTGERELTHDAPNDRNPKWSPDGQRVAFFSNRSGKNQIWSIRPDGSELRQLTFALGSVSSYNVWSPDGSRMAYQGMLADEDTSSRVNPGRTKYRNSSHD